MPINSDYILFLDLETTGNTQTDEIIEVGLVVLDSKTLEQLGEYSIIVQPSEAALDRLVNNPVVVKMHTENGLLDAITVMNFGVSLQEADGRINDWINTFTKSTNHVPYGGSGVAHFDRPYIIRQLPKLNKRITYWALDVGTVRRIMQLAGQKTMSIDSKTHRALDDAKVHADELRWYVKKFQVIGKYEDLLE